MNSLIHNENLGKLLKFLPKGVTAILVVIFAIMLASLVWLFVAPQNTLPIVSSVQKTKLKKQEPLRNYGKMVANQHLFGQAEAKKITGKKKKKPKVTPVTRLDLVLYGIVAREGRKSYAIISKGKQGKQEIYGVGDEPQTGVKIDSILPKKVKLKHAGKIEELLLIEKKKSSRANAHLPSLPKSRMPKLSLGAAGVVPLPGEGAADKLPEDDLAALRDSLANNPDKILEIANITEAKDKDGNLIGFRLSPGKNRKLFRKLGLRPGDIVTQVNGVVLDSPAKGIMVMNELSSADSVAITVKRGDEEVSIEKPF